MRMQTKEASAGKLENGGPRWLVKGYDSAGTDQLRQGSQSGNGIGKKLENETAHQCIEWLVARKLAHIGLREGHIVQAGLGHTRSGPGLNAGRVLPPHLY